MWPGDNDSFLLLFFNHWGFSIVFFLYFFLFTEMPGHSRGMQLSCIWSPSPFLLYQLRADGLFEPGKQLVDTANLQKTFPGIIGWIEIRVDGTCTNCLKRSNLK